MDLLEKKDKHYNRRVELARFYKAMYTGKGQDYILDEYRKNETDDQKKQRRRLTKTRTKHLCTQIENIYDKLRTLDKSAINISGENESLTDIIYNENIEERCFQFVKYGNLLDANSFVVFGVKDDKVTFNIVDSPSVYHYSYSYDRFNYMSCKTSFGFAIYYPDRTEEYFEEVVEGGEKIAIGSLTVYKLTHQTKIQHCFRLGIKKDIETMFDTCIGLLEPASELFYNLIWDGSEFDIIKALHGIVRTYAFADRCNYRTIRDGNTISCESGLLTHNQGKCPSCVGGLKIPTSSQDVQYFERPLPGQDQEDLSKMVHHQVIDPNILEIRKNDLVQLEDKIIRTVFNSNFVNQKDLVATATESKIDHEGVVSALGTLGGQVSECFIWACECIAQYLGIKNVEIFHGYSLDFSMDTVGTLINQRAAGVAAGVPKHIIDVIDFAILKKQHIDNPNYIDQLSTWEKFRPFSDKSTQEKLGILAILDNEDLDKQLYLNFQKVRTEILETIGDNFYNLPYQRKKELIYKTLNDELTRRSVQQLG